MRIYRRHGVVPTIARIDAPRTLARTGGSRPGFSGVVLHQPGMGAGFGPIPGPGLGLPRDKRKREAERRQAEAAAAAAAENERILAERAAAARAAASATPRQQQLPQRGPTGAETIVYTPPKPTVTTQVTAQAGSATASDLQAQAERELAIANFAQTLATQAAAQGNTESAARLQAHAQQNIANANALSTQIVQPQQPDTPQIPMYDAATVQARGVVDTYTQAFNNTIETLVKPQIFPDGVQQYKSDPQTVPLIQYPTSLLPCSAENTARIGVRADIYARAQQALAQLSAVKPPWAGNSQPLGSAQREYAARLFADWLTCVYSWVSLAYFSTNIQPMFLNPVAPETIMTSSDGKLGALAPDKKIPPEMQSVVNDLMGAPMPDPSQFVARGENVYFDAAAYAEGREQPFIRSPHEALEHMSWGPLWTGFYNSDVWMLGSFRPSVDPRSTAKLLNDSDGVYPQNYIPTSEATPTQGHTTTRSAGQIRDDIRDPWHWWYQQALHNSPGQTTYTLVTLRGREFGAAFADKRGERTRAFVYPAVDGVVRMANGWINTILGTSLTEHTINASVWYMNNHVTYWAERGLIDMNIEEAREYQVAASKAQVEANAQRAQAVIAQVGGAVAPIAASNPLALGITVGVTTLASGLTSLIGARRAKSAAKKAGVMQPLVLRSLSEVPCSAFDRGGTLPESLVSALSRLTSELAHGGAEAVTTVTVAPNLAPAADGSIVANPVITQVTTNPATFATNPSSLPIIPSGGDALTTSTSGSLPTASGTTPAPMPTTADIAAAINAAPNVVSTVPGRTNPWVWVGGGLVLTAGLLLLAKRR